MLLFTELSNLHLSDQSGGDADTLGPLPGIGTGPGGWSSSDDQMSLPPYEAHQYIPHPIAVHPHMGTSASPGKSYLLPWLQVHKKLFSWMRAFVSMVTYEWVFVSTVTCKCICLFPWLPVSGCLSPWLPMSVFVCFRG